MVSYWFFNWEVYRMLKKFFEKKKERTSTSLLLRLVKADRMASCKRLCTRIISHYKHFDRRQRGVPCGPCWEENMLYYNSLEMRLGKHWEHPISFEAFALKGRMHTERNVQYLHRWYWRMSLFFSSTDISYLLYRFILPKLQGLAVSEIPLLNEETEIVSVRNARILTVSFYPSDKYMIIFPDTDKGWIKKTTPEICCYDVIVLEDRSILDLTIGQYNGTVGNFWYRSMEDWAKEIPGSLIGFTNLSEWDVQFTNKEYREIRSKILKDKNDITNICASCFIYKYDMPTCTRCQRVYYCCKDCQKAHWITHKRSCIPLADSITNSLLTDSHNHSLPNSLSHFIHKYIKFQFFSLSLIQDCRMQFISDTLCSTKFPQPPLSDVFVGDCL